MSAAATLVANSRTSSVRLLAAVTEAHGRRLEREPVFDRLAAALGCELAERLVAALSKDALERLDAGLSPGFAERLAALAREAA